MHPPRDVRHDERLGAQRLEDPHGKRDLLQGVALVAVKPPLHDRHAALAERAEEQPAGVGLDRGCREARDVRIRDRGLRLELLGEPPSPVPRMTAISGMTSVRALTARTASATTIS